MLLCTIPLFIIVRGDMEEDSYIVSNFHSICRLCLRKNGVMSSLFEYVFEDSEVPLYERISELAELQVCSPLLLKYNQLRCLVSF